MVPSRGVATFSVNSPPQPVDMLIQFMQTRELAEGSALQQLETDCFKHRRRVRFPVQPIPAYPR